MSYSTHVQCTGAGQIVFDEITIKKTDIIQKTILSKPLYCSIQG